MTFLDQEALYDVLLNGNKIGYKLCKHVNTKISTCSDARMPFTALYLESAVI